MSLTRRQLLLLSLLSAPALGKGVLDWQRENLLIASQLERIGTGGKFMLLKPEHTSGVGGHPEKTFHGYPIRASAILEAADTRFLCAALSKSLRRYSIRDGVSKSFAPRHGLRLPQLDLLISFECWQLYAYSNGRPQHGYLRGGQEAFDQQAKKLLPR